MLTEPYFRCQARQYSDQMVCPKCHLTWDTNDENPPRCNKGVPVVSREAVETIRSVSTLAVAIEEVGRAAAIALIFVAFALLLIGVKS